MAQPVRKSLDLTVRDGLADLGPMADSIDLFLGEHGFPPEMAFQINLCLDELVTNSLTHGAEDGTPIAVAVGLKLKGRQVEIRLTDDGVPYDPFSAPEPDVEASIEDRPIGGLGIHFVRTFMDRTAYRRTGDQNVVTMVKAVR